MGEYLDRVRELLGESSEKESGEQSGELEESRAAIMSWAKDMNRCISHARKLVKAGSGPGVRKASAMVDRMEDLSEKLNDALAQLH